MFRYPSCNSCKCEQCNFTATKEATLKDHFTNKHGASSKFDCKFCSLTAPLLRNPKRHIGVNHGKITCLQIHYFLTISLTTLHTEHVHMHPDTIQQHRKNFPFFVTCVVFLSFNLMIWMATYKDAM